jgi:NAD+-dependent secondary alcohol dehydrogenase Adh1
LLALPEGDPEMRAARIHSYEEGRLHLDEVPEPSIEDPHDVIVRVGGAGLCRTDLHVVEGILKEVFPAQLPFTLGHETAGWVEEAGSSVTTVSSGDPVIVHPLVSCGKCAGCRRGEDMYCQDSVFPGLTTDGGFAEYLRTGERALVRIDSSLEPKEVAPFADAGLSAYRASKRAARVLPPGSRCVVIGIGGLGHIAIQCLRALSATSLIAVDVVESHLSVAAGLGADHLVEGGEGVVDRIMDVTGGRGVDAVLDCVGENGVPEQIPPMLALGGTYFVLGYGETVSVPNTEFVARELSVVGNQVGSYTELSELMALAAAGKVRLHMQPYALKDINQAIADMYAGLVEGRGVLVPPDTPPPGLKSHT